MLDSNKKKKKKMAMLEQEMENNYDRKTKEK